MGVQSEELLTREVTVYNFRNHGAFDERCACCTAGERHLRLGLELALGERVVGSLTRDPYSWRYRFQSFLSVACEGPISATRAGWQARCPSDPSILQKCISMTESNTPSSPLSGGMILTSSKHHGRSCEFDAQAVRFVVFIPMLANSTLYPYRYHVED